MVRLKRMEIFGIRLDGDLDRALDRLDSERDVNVSDWVRSLLRAGLVEQQGVRPRGPS